MKNKVVLRTIAAALAAVAVLVMSVGCGEAERTRLKLERGLVGGGVWQEEKASVEYVLSMLDTEYVGLDRGDPAVAEVKASASVVLAVYEAQHEVATVYVTDGCRILVEESDGGLWYAVTPGVDTVLICAEFAEGVSHEKDTDPICTMVTGTQESQETAAEKVYLDFSDVQIMEGYYITEINNICEQVYFDDDLFEVVLDYVENIEFQVTSDVPDEECFSGTVVISYCASDIPLGSNTVIFWDENHRAWVYDMEEGRWMCETEKN
jgi:hypothetical protein